MNNLRIHEKNTIHVEIKTLRGFIVHTERSIASAIDESIIEKFRHSIVEKNERIILLENRLTDVDNGKLDEELEKSVLDNLAEANNKGTITLARKEHIAEQKRVRAEKAKESMDGLYSSKRDEKMAEKNVRYTLKYFDKMCEFIPDYLQKSLEDKPNNRGFIWKGIQLYGLKPSVDDPKEFELMERISKEVLNIHIWNEFVYEIYSKKYGELPVKIYHLERRKKFKIPTGITFSR